MNATEEVLHELERIDDDVLDWAKKHGRLFVEVDDDIQGARSYAACSQLVRGLYGTA